jgi:YfiR/HmsC-like
MALHKPLNHRRPYCRTRAFVAICLAVLIVALPTKRATATGPSEYEVKAVFLFNFAKFVEWPDNAFPDASTPFVIGVLGQDPFGSYLDETVRGERLNSRPLIVQRYRNAGEIKHCNVLFISRSESDRLDQIVASLKYRRILTVTDAATGEVVIRFVNDGNRIRFKIDVQAAKAANLTISSKLLRLA